jgi:hypothetical protein
MAKNDNLKDFLTDVADAIREKKGTEDLINPQDFSDEIKNLPSGGEVAVFAEDMEDNGMGFNAVKNVHVKYGTTKIAPYAFNYAQSLETMDLPNTIVEIGPYAFRNAVNLKPFILPPKLTRISNYMLTGVKWSEINIHEGITSVGYAAFYSCSNFVQITFPQSLEIIESYAFESCSSLTTIHLGQNIRLIQSGAFVRSSKLSKVIIEAVVPPSLESSCFDSNASNRLFYVPDASVDAYKSATNWAAYADAIRPMSELPQE